jgi:hypothetical protein
MYQIVWQDSHHHFPTDIQSNPGSVSLGANDDWMTNQYLVLFVFVPSATMVSLGKTLASRKQGEAHIVPGNSRKVCHTVDPVDKIENHLKFHNKFLLPNNSVLVSASLLH